jgi:DNA repair photolyase
MGLNKQKGNMYGFITHTWNAIKGKCFHDCSYCYMKKWGEQKPVRFDLKELNTDLGKDNYIFVGSSCDMFAKNIAPEWIQGILNHCRQYNNHYLFQTKNPSRLQFFEFPKKTTLCVTIESNYDIDKNYAPKIKDRVYDFANIDKFTKMLTIEPIMDFDIDRLCDIVDLINPIQVNIGADSGNNHLKEPSNDKILSFIKCLKDSNIKVFEKDNLKRLIK